MKREKRSERLMNFAPRLMRMRSFHVTRNEEPAAAERVFSLFNERQDGSLQDYIEASLMLKYNKRD